MPILNLYSSPILDLDFITSYVDNIDSNIILQYTVLIDRFDLYHSVINIFKDIYIAAKIEASVFEYSLVYTIINNYPLHYIPSIYNDKKNSILANLNDPIINNNSLKYNIFNNIIDPQIIAFLEPNKIHPDRWADQIKKKELIEFKKNNLRYTNLYKCYKCGERKCHATQLQVRSADEPMTTYVTCAVCSNTWKYN